MALLSMRLYPGAGRPEAVFTCRRSHWLFSSMPCTQTPTILPVDFQIQSCSVLRFGPFCQVATWNHPEITNFPGNPSTALSSISRLQWDQLDSLSFLGFSAKFHSAHVTHCSSCWDDGKDKPMLGYPHPRDHKHQNHRQQKLLNRKIFLKYL